MLTTLLCSALLLQLLGAFVMVAKMRRAPEGYEDDAGFHRGAQPGATVLSHEAEVMPVLPSWAAETHRLAS